MKVGIIGTGSWGTALAQVIADNGHYVKMYGRDENEVKDINKLHKNIKYFGEDVFINEHVKATNHLEDVINKCPIILLSIPTKAMRSVLLQIKPILQRKTLFINTAKGFDPDTDMRMSEVINDVIPEEFRYPVVSLIGPSHAEEVILRHLTCVCSVSKSISKAKKVQCLFSNEYFRVYTNKDEVGAEISVAMKNSIAIASGILEGLGMGDNARAALVTRGLSEIVTFGRACGGKLTTFYGLTGIGDLMVTCNSKHSRNFMAGYAIGKANSAVTFLKDNTTTVEGIRTTEVIHRLNKKLNLHLPIVEGIYSVLFEDAKPSEVVSLLMVRPLRSEENLDE